MRLSSVVVVVVAAWSCGSEPVRSLSLCELGVSAKHAGKGTLREPTKPLTENEVRSFEMTDPVVGPAGVVEFRADQALTMSGIADGGVYLVTWTTLSGVSNVGGQGLFWEFAPGHYENARLFGGNLEADGQVVGGVDEATLRSELLRGAGLGNIAACQP